MFSHKSMFAVLVKDTDEEPALPSVDEPPTLTDNDGFVGKVYNTKVLVIYL